MFDMSTDIIQHVFMPALDHCSAVRKRALDCATCTSSTKMLLSRYTLVTGYTGADRLNVRSILETSRYF